MHSARIRLDGWKAISSRLGVSERTARRYESQESLPVHRHIHEKAGSVFAWSDELESWKLGRSTAGAKLLPSQDLHYPGALKVHASSPLDASGSQDAVAWAGRLPECPPLIGRNPERDSLLEALNAAAAHHGSVVMVGGEPGVGKTHLTKVLMADAAKRGYFGIRGQCREMEGSPPYGPFLDMMEHCARVLPHNVLREWLGDSAAEIARIVPALRKSFGGVRTMADVPADYQRRLLFNACRDFIERSAHRQPVVAISEDLHWADDATLLLFSFLAESVSSIPVLLVATYRNAKSDISRPLSRVLESCYRHRSTTRLVLQSLPLPEVGALLEQLGGERAPDELVRFVFERTEGNPFFVEELFFELSRQSKLLGEQVARSGASLRHYVDVPEGVRLLIRRRLDTLREQTLRVLSLAAIVGQTFPVRVLEELETDHPDAVLNALEEAEQAGVIEADSVGRETKYRFVHELIRQTLIEAFSFSRRQRLHAQVAGAIERLYVTQVENHASVLAHHYYEAGAAVPVGQTVAYLVMASHSASAAAAHEDALTHIDRALLLARSEGLPGTAVLIASRAAILRSLSRMDEAIHAYDQAIELFVEEAKPSEAAEASHALGHIHLWRADPITACAVLERAVQSFPVPATADKYRLELLEAVCLGVKGDMAAFAALGRAKNTAMKLTHPSPDMIGYAQLCEAHISYFAVRLNQARESAREAAAAFRQAGNLWAEVETYESVSGAMWEGNCGPEVDRALSQALLRAELVGNQNAVWTYRFMSSELLMHRGNLDQAERTARQVHEFATAISAPWAFIDHILLAAIAHYRGNMDEAVKRSRTALDLEPECYMSGLATGSLYFNLAAQGSDKAESALIMARRRLPRPGQLLTLGSSSCFAFVVEGLALQGRIEEAAALAEAAEWVVANTPAWLYSRHLFRTSAGIVAACARNWGPAEDHHRTAVHIADSAACRVAQPSSRYW